MSKPKYDALGGALAALQPNDADTVPSPPSAPRQSAEPRTTTKKAPPARRTGRTQLNLNVDATTKARLDELWAGVAATHTRGQLLEHLILNYGDQAVDDLNADA